MQYRIYKDNVKIKETTSKQVEIAGLKPKTTYTLGVSAYNGLRESTRATITMTTRGLIMIVDKALQVGSEVTFEYVEYPLGVVPIGTEPAGLFGGGNRQTLKGSVVSVANGQSRVELKTSFDKLSDELKLETNLQVSGLNYLQGTADFTWPGGIGENGTPKKSIENYTDNIKMLHISSDSYSGIYTKWGQAFPNEQLQVGDDYTFSFDAKGRGAIGVAKNESDGGDPLSGTNLTNEWHRFSVSGKINNLNKAFIIYFRGGYDVYLKCVKIEKGTHATPWTPARQDIYGTNQLDANYSGFDGYKAIYLK